MYVEKFCDMPGSTFLTFWLDQGARPERDKKLTGHSNKTLFRKTIKMCFIEKKIF